MYVFRIYWCYNQLKEVQPTCLRILYCQNIFLVPGAVFCSATYTLCFIINSVIKIKSSVPTIYMMIRHDLVLLLKLILSIYLIPNKNIL
jgi:hypothetical protein